MDEVRQDIPGKGNSMVRGLRGDGASEEGARREFSSAWQMEALITWVPHL